MSKMRYFCVSYAHQGGFGRKLFGRTGDVSEDIVFLWEKECAKGRRGSVCIIAISEIDGPVTQVKEIP